MKYSYFCPGKAGKYLIRDMFWYNNKTHSLFCCGTPPIYAVMSTPAADFDWYWEDDITGNLVIRIKENQLKTGRRITHQKTQFSDGVWAQICGSEGRDLQARYLLCLCLGRTIETENYQQQQH